MRQTVLAPLLGLAGALGAAGWYASAQDASETATLKDPPVQTAQGTAPHAAQSCLSPGDLREAVADKRVVAPVAAIRAAQAAVPRAEIVRASLCQKDEALVYMMTALRRDGQFVHVVVDARSGKVAGLW
ncbi:PepSY domain-containing protein [uncultured Methylobacterium sp.]|uniref:PepSY domain-containing protein n=1 Tax=uncultured Methylobacterium sp. TaxID=157278 RepID=UPI0026059797|nr:PepSY domain-containing protein [uncultured Methylobacterium sp.]